jgi:hypothetical protein
MIKNLDGLEYIKELLANDAPTTEIVEVIDTLASQTQNFDAAIFLSISDENQLTLNVGGDTTSQCYGIAVIHLLDVIHDKLNNLLLEAEEKDTPQQLSLDDLSSVDLSSLERVSTAQE